MEPDIQRFDNDTNLPELCAKEGTIIAKHVVPMDLIPINTSSLTMDWARTTLKYHKCFDASVRDAIPSLTETDADFNLRCSQWIECAKRIIDNLQNYSTSIYHVECNVQLTSTRFNLVHPSTKVKISTVAQLLELIREKDWYNNNKGENLKTIYFFQHGIFTNGQDEWAHAAANKWLDNMNLMYDDSTSSNNSTGNESNIKLRKKKGFVLKFVTNYASDSYGKKLRNAMKSTYGEYITIRRKVKAEDFLGTEFKAYGKSFYLEHIPDNINENDETLKLFHEVKGLKEKGVPYEVVEKIIKEVYNSAGSKAYGKLKNIEIDHYIIQYEFNLTNLMIRHSYNFIRQDF